MHSLRISLSSLAVVCFVSAATVVGSVGCKATVSTGEAAPPPPPPAPPPPPDKDGDTITDAKDACPDKAGPASDDATKNGCPVEAPPAPVESKVQIVGNEVRISEKIMFDIGKATIKPESSGLLDEIATVIKTGGQAIDLIEVEGHADKQGDEKANVKLTDDRAKAVVDELVKRGVDPKKLRAKAYGQYWPIDDANTPEAYEKNRRVEFTILKVGGKVTDGAAGCENATKHGVKAGPVL